jgi:hypothetical protein
LLSFIFFCLPALGGWEIRGHDMEEWVEDESGVHERGGGEHGSDSGLHLVHSSIELCDAAKTAISPVPGPGRTRSTVTAMETPMQHFHMGNRHQIKDAPPNTWATVNRSDVVTMSELARRGFHLVDMSGEIWTMHREG